jgi:hypothetical protein
MSRWTSPGPAAVAEGAPVLRLLERPARQRLRQRAMLSPLPAPSWFERQVERLGRCVDAWSAQRGR